MTQNELHAFLAGRSKGEPHDISPGELDHLEGADGHRRGISIVNDRTLGSCGPSAFDGPAFRKMLGSTRLVFLDYAAEPDLQFYGLLTRAVAIGVTVLVIQTTEDRDEVWLEYLITYWVGDSDAMIAPARGRGRWAFRRMDGGEPTPPATI
jgi:hypothetical protein